MARSTSGESVLERAVRILEVFDADHITVTITDIAERAGLPLSTASRLVDDLVGLGLLRRDEGRRVRIGVRLWELASRASPTLGLREAAMPFLEDVHAIVGHHVQLGVLDGAEVLFVERLSSPGAVINVTRVAGRLSLHASSAGLVLLAHAPAGFQERVLSRTLPRYTAQTIVDPRHLRAFLAEVRRSGVAVCPGFIHEDATGIAVPIRDSKDLVVAAISVVVPRDDRPTSHVAVLQAAARGIGRELRRPIDRR
ncbi:putative IclR family transcriptional regulator [Gordonia polyisoprenivorans NBRC 16320 = JCM 10675]|uniref:IclR family transcriptional regulator n=1 Tax=Gordonia polyisoprenivorans TaxID=84595 RepID=A0A846WSC4_9ACTN|nr:IclR family transcriptional regulator [Gordonia polyisoprenivorans]NKY04499.1 IclR family transcriptional regulator [Gordonia polyisoprenivorans]GAB23250.1 putative IclR family transcriptional regulator [Gordonia polyisoprenivorans NBRC 16320 = JCM 10675]